MSAFDPAKVPWNGRLSVDGGDLSLRLLDLGRMGSRRLYRLEVTNEGSSPASEVVVEARDIGVGFGPLDHPKAVIDTIAPGETVAVAVTLISSREGLSITALASSIEDGAPEDHTVAFEDAIPARRRFTRH